METTKSTTKTQQYYVSLPNLGYAIRKSTHDYKWAVIARNRESGKNSWTEWYVARWSSQLSLAEAHANYLSKGCPAVKKHNWEFETKVVPVTLFSEM
jgi:hypothetical protein